MVTAKRARPYDYEELLKLEKGKLKKSAKLRFEFSFTTPPTFEFWRNFEDDGETSNTNKTLCAR
jgi:hypothetical protein